MSKKLSEYIKVVAAMKPVAQEGADDINTGIIIDRLGFEDGVLVVQTGAISGTPTATAISGVLVHGDAANLSDADDFLSLDIANTADTVSEIPVDLSGAKRYVKFVPTVAFTGGTTPKIVMGATLVLGNAKVLPV